MIKVLKKQIEEYIDEFIMIEGLEKYKRKNVRLFSDGRSVNNWFAKYEDDILSSDDKRCLKIKQEYNLYIEDRERTRAQNSQGLHSILFSERDYLREFVSIGDPSKFEPDCNIFLSNNENAYKFFGKIIIKIMDYNDHLCKQAKKQYMDYKAQKLKMEYKKNLFCFYKEKRMGKFDLNSRIKLQNNITAGVWFDSNKDKILSSESPIEKEIKKQYESYLIHCGLALEFFEKDDIGKFDIDANVRFLSRAPMNMWWEDNQEKMRYSDLDIDKKIIEQYDEIVKKTKKFK